MNIALTLVFGLLSVSMQGEKEREGSFSGLIQDKALPNLEKPANVTQQNHNETPSMPAKMSCQFSAGKLAKLFWSVNDGVIRNA